VNKLRQCLVVEDSEDDAQLVLRELRRAGYDVTWERVETAVTMRAALERQPWDFILCDYNLPQFSGLAALELLRASGLDLPIIIVSGTIGEEQATEAMLAGASDYVMKDKLGRLGPAVERGLREAAGRREQKRAETTLREGEAEFRAMFEMASIGMAQANPSTGQWLRVNAKMCAITGYSADELLGMRIAEVTHPEDRERDGEALQRVIRGEAPDYQMEQRYVRKDGTLAWVNVNMTVIRDAAGQPTRTMATIEDINARKQAEAALREFNQQLEARVRERTAEALDLYENAPCAYYSLDADGLVLQINDTALRWLGYQREEVQGRLRLAELLTFAAAERFNRLYPQFVRSGTLHNTESELRRKDGTAIAILSHAEAQRATDGRFIQTRCTVLDISGRKQSEALLQHLTDRLTLAARAGGVGIWDYDLVNNRLVWDEQMFRLYGITQAQFSGAYAAWQAGVHPEDRERGDAEIQAAICGEKDFNTEFRVVWPDGSTHHIRALALLRRDAAGQPLNVVGTNWDITAEVQLRNLWSTVEQSPVVVMITDAAGIIEYVNPRFYQQTGYTPAEAVGRNPRFLKSGRHTPEFYAAMWATLRTGQTWRGELCNRRKDGALFWESTAIAPVQNAAGRITHFVASKEDITERRRIAEELRQAKEAADAANLAKSQFLANMSHEIRTPMNAILGFSQLLLRSPELPALQRRQLTTINRSGEHLMEIINDILEIARIESGRVTLNLAPLDLHRLLDDLEPIFRPRAQAKDLRFHAERQGHVPPRVVGDEIKLRQVFINLLGNAVKFTPGGGSIVLRLRAEPDGADAWRLHAEVADSGAGIAPEDLGHLFEPFFQAATGRQTAGGTGLGLAISRKFVRLMDGEISVDSQPGVGSCFRFQVRVGRTDAASARTESAPAPRVLHLKAGQPACRVLAVDDQPENRELIVEMLAPIGFEIRTAADGAEAVTRCAEWLPQIVLMDLRMPVLDGYEATRRIRAAHGAAVKLIVLSAFAFAEDDQRASAAGADAFLSKPFQETKLLDLIQQLVGVEYVNGDAVS
jgi:PAS domain S-box-containing protein